MAKLFLQRHLKSQWNVEDRFAGWTNAPVAKESLEMTKSISNRFAHEPIDMVFTSPLMRNMQTVLEIFKYFEDGRYPFFIQLDAGNMKDWGNFTDIGDKDVNTYVSEKLNERYYGDLQGLNKAETKKKYGEDQVRLWRTSYTDAPPKGESGQDVYERTVPFFKEHVEKELKAGKNILIVSSHHPLRAIIKYIENIPAEKMVEVEIPFAGLVEYEFDGDSFKKVE
ncbi:MAG: histidine phosphatase family protein [bacterium]|nr:histidine phosphatase family protein [bacterium]